MASLISVLATNAPGNVTPDPATLSVKVPIVYSTTTLLTLPNGNAGPNGVAVDPSGNVYVTVGNAIERITSTGSVILLAGSLTSSGSADGTGSNASFYNPTGISTDSAGNIYVADSGNNSIRKVTALGVVTTLAGLIQGNADGVGIVAQFNNPAAVAVDNLGNVYVADIGNNEIRKITSNGTTTTLLNGSSFTFANPPPGPFTQTTYLITGVAVDVSGIPYIGVLVTNSMESSRIISSYVLEVSGTGASSQLFNVPGGGTSATTVGDGELAYSNGPGLFLLSEGNLYQGTGLISPLGMTIFGELLTPVAISADSFGRIFEAIPANGTVVVVSPIGSLPTITTGPVGATIAFGASTTLSVVASGDPAPTYQWQVDGVDITGASSSSYVTSMPGTYTVMVTNTAGTVTSGPAVVTAATRLANISSRALVGTGADLEVVGFVVSGPPGTTEQVLVRGVGPTLAQFGVPGVLTQPVLTLLDSKGDQIATNAGWNTASNASQIAAAAIATGAFPLPLDSADSALLISLAPGAYSAEIIGQNGTTGAALAEVYEVKSGDPELINISTRAYVSSGTNVEISGFVVTGSQNAKVLIRAIGPTLSQFGVGGVLAQPSLSVVNSSGTTVASNIGWSTNANADAIATEMMEVGAFALPSGSADSVLLLSLPPGSYTAVVSGVGGTSGVALVEVYGAP